MGMIGRFATRMRLSLLVRLIVEFPTQQNSRPVTGHKRVQDQFGGISFELPVIQEQSGISSTHWYIKRLEVPPKEQARLPACN